MKYYLIAGEASGDLHGSGLMNALGKLDPDAEFRFWGGDLMEREGGTLVRHIRTTSLMGFWEVVKNVRQIYSHIRFCEQDILKYNPDALILIDYPGFNLRMARYAKKRGIRVIYFISPKVWAWNQSRVRTIKKYVDYMLTILPFETEFYEKFGYKVDYIGNPLVDAIENRSFRNESFIDFIKRNNLPDKPLISILPGSRVQEIKKSLPIMLSLKDEYPDFQFVIAGAPAIDPALYSQYTGDHNPVLFGQTYAILQQSSAAMVVSGTATLETALLGVPQVVCYRASPVSYHIAKRFIRVRYISLVNLIMDRQVVRELIQHDFNREKLKDEMDKLLFNRAAGNEMKEDLSKLKKIVGPGGACKKAAEKIDGYLKIRYEQHV